MYQPLFCNYFEEKNNENCLKKCILIIMRCAAATWFLFLANEARSKMGFEVQKRAGPAGLFQIK